MTRAGRWLRNTQLWQGAFRRAYWTDTPRDRADRIAGNVWLHLHPVFVRPRALEWAYTFGLGGISFLCFLVLTFTGIILMIYFPPAVLGPPGPSQDAAYWTGFAKFNSNVHAWAAEGLMLCAILHMLRVFLTAAYKKPRQFNWCVGVVLLFLAFFLILSGKMIPWEFLSVWGRRPEGLDPSGTLILVLGDDFYKSIADMAAAKDFRYAFFGDWLAGERALVFFYVLHCVALPLLFGIFLIVHFWRIRKDGFSAAPYREDEEKLDVWPHLVKREYLAAKVCLAALAVLGLWGPVPEASNELHVPWWAAAFPVLLRWFDMGTVGRLIPAAALMALLALPYVDRDPRGVGYYSALERPAAALVFGTGFLCWLVLTLMGA